MWVGDWDKVGWGSAIWAETQPWAGISSVQMWGNSVLGREKREENQVQTPNIGACLACAWKEGRLMWWTHMSKSGKWRPENWVGSWNLDFMLKWEVGRRFWSREGHNLVCFPRSLCMLCEEWIYFSFVIWANTNLLSSACVSERIIFISFFFFCKSRFVFDPSPYSSSS